MSKIIYVDLDGTLCETEGLDYSESIPKFDKINIINSWYDDGHTIVIYTARGSGTGLPWRDVTEKQLEEWGVKYHSLSVGEKPVWDMLIDDKAYNISDVGENFEVNNPGKSR